MASGKGAVKRKETDGRLSALKRAHGTQTAAGRPAFTPRVEDYVEVIYELILEKGYARIIDIGQHLNVSSPTATKMIQRLDEEGLVHYERYRGITLSEEGEELAKHLRRRHDILARFLRALGVDEATAHRDTEGIEHHLDPQTVERIVRFVEYAEAHPDWISKFRQAHPDGRERR